MPPICHSQDTPRRAVLGEWGAISPIDRPWAIEGGETHPRPRATGLSSMARVPGSLRMDVEMADDVLAGDRRGAGGVRIARATQDH